jgi:hypothetical protein
MNAATYRHQWNNLYDATICIVNHTDRSERELRCFPSDANAPFDLARSIETRLRKDQPQDDIEVIAAVRQCSRPNQF